MGIAARTVSWAAALICAAVFSQAPEFSQQYRQRLGGAIGELKSIVENFDRDAARSELTREEALELYGATDDAFLQDRGRSMQAVFARYDKLVAQRAALDHAGAIAAPFHVLTAPDLYLVEETREDFAPALPLTPAGVVYAGFGLALVALIIALISSLRRIGARRYPVR